MPIGDFKLHDFAAKFMMQMDDIAEIGGYRDANRKLLAEDDARTRAVLLGDSITYYWEPACLPAPAHLDLVNRGIPGQNTSQMLLRFQDDVVALKPAAVVILGGTNDLRVYIGEPSDPHSNGAIVERATRNITSMVDIATARGIRVILCTLPPLGMNHTNLGRDPGTQRTINSWLKSFARSRDFPVADYHEALADERGQLSEGLSSDGLHPNRGAYELMWPRLRDCLSAVSLPSMRE
ncbi:MAG: GDSL-type esterase/lipase family protein [Gammaproteobacteria bacterium]